MPWKSTSTTKLTFNCQNCNNKIEIRTQRIYTVKKTVHEDGRKVQKKFSKSTCPNCGKGVLTEKLPERGKGSTNPSVAPATQKVTGTDLKLADPLFEGLPNKKHVGDLILKQKLYKRFREKYPDKSEDEYDTMVEKYIKSMERYKASETQDNPCLKDNSENKSLKEAQKDE